MTPFIRPKWKPFLSYIFILASLSCETKSNNPNEIIFTKEDVKEYAITASRKMEQGRILQPSNILYKNGLLVLTEDKADTLIHLLDAETLDYLSSKGVAGYGPGEIPSIWNLDSGPSDSTFWAYSLEGKIFNEYSLYGDNPLASQQIKQSEDFFLAVGIAWASPHSLMTYLVSGEDKYVEYNQKFVMKAKLQRSSLMFQVFSLNSSPYSCYFRI